MPFQIPSIRIAQASPSLSLEKGSYRLRAPPARLSPSPSSSRPSSSRLTSTHSPSPDGTAREPTPQARFVPASYEKRMALLVALLGCAMLLSFGTAYWLWTTGHRHRP
ncbi:hypothetical protein ONZ51_g7613 [Trametes cubensis]|uniref:Uncharacterized protein n=1 Tax=Trametes cubensis TaxID=1111947 RepID=A0AAD7TPT2_9APHY|nr:hypothetical protein ONZ51_g7613 [Trametes cubensis]